MMRCDNLDEFFDGELPADSAQAFRDHLATCSRCQHVLRGRMLEAVVVDSPGSCTRPGHEAPSPIDELAARRWSRPWVSRQWMMITASVALAAMAVLVLRPHGPTDPGTVVATADSVTLESERPYEARFSDPMFDRYRAQRVVRAAAEPHHDQIAAAIVAALERSGRTNALVAARALNGDVHAAIGSAKKLPATAQSLSDRAALELVAIENAQGPVPRARKEQVADLVISLTSDALRLDPTSIHAMWNKAIALKLLQLPLEAARVFDEIAQRREVGWSTEAASKAQQLRTAYDTERKDWKQLQDEITQMIVGGAPLTAGRARHAPSEARKALYQAIATASTRRRFDELLPLAEVLDEAFSTKVLAAMVKRVQTSNLAARAPVAQSLTRFIADRRPPGEIHAIRERAIRTGLGDIALASFLAVPFTQTDDPDPGLLGRLVKASQDDWWRVFEILRRTYILQYIARDPSRAEATARTAAPLCGMRDLLCSRITMLAGAANADMGRLDIALEQLDDARELSRQPATKDEEAVVLNVIAQVMSTRVQAAIDSVAVSDAYFGEYALRNDSCDTRLQGLDFVALAALDRHRYQQAAEFRARADALESGACSSAPLRLNGETVRLRLLVAGLGTAAALHQKLAILEQTETRARLASYIDFLRAAALAVTDRANGDAALRRVVADADANPSKPLAPLARSMAYQMLIENAAAAREADGFTTLLAQRLGVEAPDRCVVAIAQWHRVVVAVRGANGEPAIETREVPEGTLMLSHDQLIPRSLQDRLAGCPRVEVLASGPYFGMANVLEPTTPWIYKSASAPRVSPARSGGELVVTDVRPPDDINLPQLRTFQGSPDAVVLRSSYATPSATLDGMKTAGLIVIVAHGITDAREPTAASLILSPDRDGEYLLTASKVRTARLDNAPVVVLAGCEAGRVQVTQEPWSLATSFLAAGARAVIAPTEQIPDKEASEAFDSLVSRIRAGSNPVDALQAERKARGPGATWLSSIVVFE